MYKREAKGRRLSSLYYAIPLLMWEEMSLGKRKKRNKKIKQVSALSTPESTRPSKPLEGS